MTLWPDDLPADDLAPVLDPRVHIEAKDKAADSEHKRQAEFVAAMRKIARRCVVFAVPNGTNIPSMKGRAKVKAEGLCTGFPDLGVSWTGGVAFIEWKNGRDLPDPNQVEVINRLAAMEWPVMVARTMPGAMQWLASLGAPVPIGARSFGEVAAGIVERVARGEPAE